MPPTGLLAPLGARLAVCVPANSPPPSALLPAQGGFHSRALALTTQNPFPVLVWLSFPGLSISGQCSWSSSSSVTQIYSTSPIRVTVPNAQTCVAFRVCSLHLCKNFRVSPALWEALCSTVNTGTPRDPPASAFPLLGLKVYPTSSL